MPQKFLRLVGPIVQDDLELSDTVLMPSSRGRVTCGTVLLSEEAG